ncbi:FecR family protein [Bacteroides sp.]|uniref:FecR family protein n=1 Tax=Bacteroides sp. TaxID=29523 RepID=UPI0025C36B39|nr:FecR family protein [Bacteroides sp.]
MNQEQLLKYISGKASQQEKEEVSTWIDADAANLKEFISLRKSYDAFIWQDTDELYKKTKKNLSLRPVVQKVLRIAAMFVIAFGLSYVVMQAFQKENIEMQTVYVPAGQRTLVTLADGTTVWVNGKSTLTFPSRFSSETRNVALDGEAYFDVQKDPKKQFIVSTAHQSAIKVLGTQFNVKAYKEDDEVTTTLIEGKVHFEFNNTSQYPQYISMAPGQKLIYYSQNGRTEVHTTSGEWEVAWKDGKIIFRQTSLRDALAILADRYDVEFVIRENVPHDDSFSGTFTNKSMEQILNFIKASSKVRWHYLNSAQGNKEKMKIEIFI